MSAKLEDVLAETSRDERQRAIQALLSTPLLREPDRPEAFGLVTRHAKWLEEWFSRHAGWRLRIDRSGRFARLFKAPSRADGIRAAAAPGKPAFDRRRYSLLCLVLAALDDAAGQTTLATLVDQVVATSREEAGLEGFDPLSAAERRALVDALLWLQAQGILCVRDGEAERYVQSADADTLYDVDERLLANLLAAPQAPSLAGSAEDIGREVYADTSEGRRQRARHTVVRRLLDDPVVYHAELDLDCREWLDHSLGWLHRLIEGEAGLPLERRAEGLAAVDPTGAVSDQRFPDGGSTVKHAALLLCERLVERARAPRADDEGQIAWSEIERWTLGLMEDVGQRSGWSKAFSEDVPGAARLARDAVALLAGFGLASCEPDGARALPAAGRFRPAAAGGRSP